jgi:hypothetical protein
MLDVAGMGRSFRGMGRGMSRFRPNQSGVGMARGIFISYFYLGSKAAPSEPTMPGDLGPELSPLGGEGSPSDVIG